MLKIAVLVLFFCFILIVRPACYGQAASAAISDKEYQHIPHWIKMMNDTSTNYFVAVKAFELFWKNKPKPIEEADILGQEQGQKEERKNFLSKLFRSKKEKQREESERYSFQFKKFKHWQLINAPYVQPDGYILTPTERVQLWERQKSEK
jgi:hypothetical protein